MQEKGRRERLKGPKEIAIRQCQFWLWYKFTPQKLDALDLQHQKRQEHALFACALASQASSACSMVCIQPLQLNMFPAFSPLLLSPSSPRGCFSYFSSLSVKQWEASSSVQLPAITGTLSASKQSLCLQGKDLRSLGFMELKNICYRFHGSLVEES